MRYVFCSVLSVYISILSCSSADEEIPPGGVDHNPPEGEEIWTVNRTNQYALNVVFFKPTDFTVSEARLSDISEMMLFIQKWYEKQMELQGFGKKTFGLVTNQKGKVKVILVQGAKPSTFYLKEEGGKKPNQIEVKREVEQYLADHPDDRASAHTFVLGDARSGVPFYGLGKMAFATSPDFKLSPTGQSIDGLELLVSPNMGGIMHELGHGLNLPHCAHKASDLPKISLMANGNHIYQQPSRAAMVFLTGSSCAILNVNEVFNTKDKQYYDTQPSVEMKAYTVRKDNVNEVTIVEGVLTSDIKATHFYVGNDGHPAGSPANNYDDVTFTVPLLPASNANEYSFKVAMPYSAVFNGYKEKGTLELSMVAIVENGNRVKPVKYDYTTNTSTRVPNDDIERAYAPFNFSERSGWTITANSTGPNRGAEFMIDGKYGTFWHSAWKYALATSGDHVITIDMGETKEIKGMYLHSDRDHAVQYRPRHIVVETSSNASGWIVAKEIEVASMEDAKEVYLNFDAPINVRHVRLVIDQVYAGNADENLIFSEVDIIR